MSQLPERLSLRAYKMDMGKEGSPDVLLWALHFIEDAHGLAVAMQTMAAEAAAEDLEKQMMRAATIPAPSIADRSVHVPVKLPLPDIDYAEQAKIVWSTRR